MATWSKDELAKIGGAEELQISSLREDGVLGSPRTIWVVRHGDGLYVRSVNGRTSAWFRGVQQLHRGHIRAGGVESDVDLLELGNDMNAELDAAYADKYHRYAQSIIDHITGGEAQSATLQLVPR